MNNLPPRLLAYYSLALVLIIFALGIVTAKSSNTIVMQIFLMPVIAYLLKSSLSKNYPPISERKTLLSGSILILILLSSFAFVNITNTSAEDAEKVDEKTIGIVFRTEKITEDEGNEDATKSGELNVNNFGDYLVVKLPDQGSYLNIRSAPSSTSDVVGQALPESRFKITGEDGNWYCVELEEGLTGWISKDFSLKE